jgi:hypothetical protein
MATYRITAPDGETYEVTAPDDASQDQVLAYAKQNFSASKEPEPGFGEKVNDELSNIPRQLGLTARHGIEGLADFAGIATNPLAATTNAAGCVGADCAEPK